MAYKNKLEELKKITVSSKELSVCMEYFLEQLSGDPDFNKEGVKYTTRNDFYKTLLKPILENRYSGKKVSIAKCYLMQIKESSFVHGIFSLSNGSLINFFFFEDIYVGIVYIPNLVGNSDYYRLTAWTSTKDNTVSPTIISRTAH